MCGDISCLITTHHPSGPSDFPTPSLSLQLWTQIGMMCNMMIYTVHVAHVTREKCLSCNLMTYCLLGFATNHNLFSQQYCWWPCVGPLGTDAARKCAWWQHKQTWRRVNMTHNRRRTVLVVKRPAAWVTWKHFLHGCRQDRMSTSSNPVQLPQSAMMGIQLHSFWIKTTESTASGGTVFCSATYTQWAGRVLCWIMCVSLLHIHILWNTPPPSPLQYIRNTHCWLCWRIWVEIIISDKSVPGGKTVFIHILLHFVKMLVLCIALQKVDPYRKPKQLPFCLRQGAHVFTPVHLLACVFVRKSIYKNFRPDYHILGGRMW